MLDELFCHQNVYLVNYLTLDIIMLIICYVERWECVAWHRWLTKYFYYRDFYRLISESICCYQKFNRTLACCVIKSKIEKKFANLLKIIVKKRKQLKLMEDQLVRRLYVGEQYKIYKFIVLGQKTIKLSLILLVVIFKLRKNSYKSWNYNRKDNAYHERIILCVCKPIPLPKT